ncbi:hypothetical protein UlMin_009838 [Ulmus minor]
MTGNTAFKILTKKLERESATTSKFPTKFGNRMIHKVHPSLRTVNKKEYEPVLVAIGPYHHGRENLQQMEKYKVRMLQLLLSRTGDTLENYVAAMEAIEEEARAYCASDIKMDRDKFVVMMILDGCFILEFLRQGRGFFPRGSAFNTSLFRHDIFRDLLLFENQMPLFVLSKLFELTNVGSRDFVRLIRRVCRFSLRRMDKKRVPEVDSDGIERSLHLLDLVYMTCKDCIMGEETDDMDSNVDGMKCFIKSASALKETGVKFEKAKQDVKLCDINFKDGVLTIPQLAISDATECLFRNFVAYEQYIRKYDFTNYLVVMDRLINTPKDVELLRHRGIIVNRLGDDESVSNMFNKIGDFVFVNISSSKFGDLCTRINEYSENRVHSWMAKLWREYFNSPWTLISIFAAFLLLGLTIVQTVFSVLSYTNPKQS